MHKLFFVRLFLACSSAMFLLFIVSCVDTATDAVPDDDLLPLEVVAPNPDQAIIVGNSVNYDVSQNGATFGAETQSELSYTITITPANNGLQVDGARIIGAATSPAVFAISVEATTDELSGVDNFHLVAFASALSAPSLPATPFQYANPDLPNHYTERGNGGRGNNDDTVVDADNTPISNLTTNAGSTLGRVLFYDKRLSRSDNISCASCHHQENGFTDPRQFSVGFAGEETNRNSMALGNACYYERGRFFWDERAETLEEQVMLPIQDGVEMGMTLDNLLVKLSVTDYYGDLFSAAFGSPEVTTDRISRALAQFVRAMVTYQSKYDEAYLGRIEPDFAAVFTAQELMGKQLFEGGTSLTGVRDLDCNRCHGTAAHISDDVHNNGLDGTITDPGAGDGEFKAPSLRNIEVTGPYMHDGRFSRLEEVVEHYNSGVRNNGNLSPRLRNQNGTPDRLNLTQVEKDALVAFMKTLTDETFLSDPKFSSPFPE